ncbi:hypothetical protein SKAU_G00319940 [Synaphobranchus kaupii]|uniref:Uncharacterized protein n=1 Tax=Synaphobranchus kaupii TaxID=118154 RepID=A0A9Q1ENL7_SYNKA|nr:hypothetical protein SKAU_G00319940 [Synaphobranchus kaupii]
MDDDHIQEILTQLCKAVFQSKGWWPSRSQMMCWCAIVLSEKSQSPKLVGFEEDPCVTAMVAAMQICTGSKLDIVLSSGALSVQETKEWTVFYKHLGISINTNGKKTNDSYSDVFQADIVYGAIEDFVTDYFQYSLEVMEGGHPQLIRGFIIEKGCLSAGQNLNFSRLKDNEALGFVAEELQSLMMDTNTNKTKDTDRKICYQKDIIYGTVETYAADHLRQTFEMKDVRPDRRYECIIIDEVDLLLLDQGIQVTYLSSPMASMQHLNIILTMIWGHVYQTGRAALVICETINKVNDLYEELKDSIPGEVIIYTRSDTNSLGALSRKLNPGDVVLATNLAGRGTNIKVTKEVNENGGLFVILSFLSENERVERQAFGRTARKGNPGSAQIIMSIDHLQECYRTVYSMEEAKNMRDSLAVEKIQDMQNDIDEMKLREDLFSEYCKTLREIYKSTEEDEQKAIVAIMNEFWGIWLLTKTEEIDQLKRKELQKSLRADLAWAKKQTESQNSPSSSIYHYVKFGNIAMKDKKWDVSARLFHKAFQQDASWAAIALYNHSYCIIKQQSGDYLTKAKDDLKKAQDSLKYFSEECMAGLSFIKMSLPKSAKGKTSSLEKQFTTKCNMLSYLNKNMSDAIKKLDEIKGKGRDALAKKAPVFTLVSDSEEELQMETFNLYDRGLKYIFTVEEEPRFPWEALVVFLLGVLQIVGGALLTAFTFGTMAQVGMGLIAEGISDCITGIESMITGEFSWESWAIDKAISIGVSLIGFGIGKLVSKGFKAAKTLSKGFSKSLKTMPKFFASQAKEGFSVAMKTNMKNAVKVAAKKMVEETVAYGIERAENEIINKILEEIEKAVKNGILNEVKTNMGKDPLHALTDSIILSHIDNKLEFNDLLKNITMKSQLLTIFTELSEGALAPYSADLGWQNQLSSSITNVIDVVKEDAGGKMKAILTAIQVTHMAVLAADAVSSVLTLADKFFDGLCKGLEDFRKKKGLSQKVKASDLSAAENKMLNDFKQEISDSISTLLAKALVELFHQKFSSHIVSIAQGKLNDVIGNYVSSGLNTEHTEKKLTAAQESTYNAHMPGDKQAGGSGEQSKSHAEKVKNSEMTGSSVDISVLSEATGTKVVILTEDKNGKLTKMQEMNPSTEDASQTVTLIYRPKSDEHPDGHYDVLVNNKTVSVEKGDVYNAMAHGMSPDASKEDIASAADDLRAKEAEALEEKPAHWEAFLQHEEWIEELIIGAWFISEGATSSMMITSQDKIQNVMKQERC